MKRITSILVFLVFIGCLAFAQEVQITGTVTSAEDGSPLPGVSILVKGTQNGTTTNVDGAYKISVNPDAILVLTFVGMQTQEVAVGGQTVINVVLEPEAIAVNEVVVTALGIQRSAKSLGYSVTAVNSDKANVKSEPDMLKALQGKVPGVDIKVSQGAPGSATKINIRGNSSFFGDNQPLIIVDGMPYSNDQVTTSDQTQGNGGAYGNGLSTLDPNSIESISVLKGAAAAALYGSRAANGVLVVKTKSGKSTQSRRGLEVTYNTSMGWEKISNLPDYQNTYGNGSNFTYSNANGSWGPRFDAVDSIPVWPAYLDAFPELFPASGNIKFKAQPDNVKSLFRTGKIYENSLTIAGGDEKSTFSMTTSALNQDGYIPNSSFDRYSVSVGGLSNLSNGLIASASLSYSKTDQVGGFFGENQFDGAASSFARALFLGRTWDMSLPYEDPRNGNPVSTNPAQYDHPLWSFKHNTITTVSDRITANMGLSYNLTNWLSLSYQLGYNNYKMNRKEVTDKGSRAAAGTGQIIVDDFYKREIESNLYMTLSKNVGSDISLKAMVGHNVNQMQYEDQAYKGTIIISSGIYDIDNTQDVVAYGGDYAKRRLWGLYGDFSMGYKDLFFLNFTGRNDWSSTLPKENRSYFYPSVSTSLIFTELLGIPENIMDFGKIRAGFAMVGSDAQDAYALQNTYVLGDPFLGQPTITTPNTANNKDLKPEKTREIELGTELKFFNSRVGLDFTWYDKLSTDMIAKVPVPVSSGFEEAYMNFGKMRNRGVEIGLDLYPVKTAGGFSWNIFTSFTKNVNKILSLKEGVKEMPIENLNIDVTPYIIEGQPYNVFKGSYALRDANNNLIIDPLTGFPYLALNEKVVGNPNPDYLLGITNTLRYKGFSLSCLFDYKKGGDFYSVTITSLLGRGVTKDTEDREKSFIIPGVYGNNQGVVYTDNAGNPIKNRTQVAANDLYFYGGGNETTFAINGAAEYEIYDGTVYRLREVTLGYDIPTKWIEKLKIGRLNISATGRNLWYFAPNVPKYTNFDPDINGYGSTNLQGLDISCAPSARKYAINLKVTF